MRQQCLLGRRQQSGCMWSHCGQLCRSHFPIADLFPMGELEARLARSLDRYRALSPGTAPSNVTTARQEITWISCGYMSLDLLGRIIASRSAAFGGLDRLAVNDASRGTDKLIRRGRI